MEEESKTRRQPDRKICQDDEEEDEVIPIDVSDDEVFFNTEAEEASLAPSSEDERTLMEQNSPDGTTKRPVKHEVSSN